MNQEGRLTHAGSRPGIFLPPGKGRAYHKGGQTGVFKADGDETGGLYSVSEWSFEANTGGLGVHINEDDHVLYVLEGVLSVFMDGTWHRAEKGAFVLIAAGVRHDFENREPVGVRFLNFNVPGGFEPGIARAFGAA